MTYTRRLDRHLIGLVLTKSCSRMNLVMPRIHTAPPSPAVAWFDSNTSARIREHDCVASTLPRPSARTHFERCNRSIGRCDSWVPVMAGEENPPIAGVHSVL